MLKDNLKQLRKSKGLTQEEMATKLNVVRQTISKWEKGLSVPDSEMLLEISEMFEMPVATLLGETVERPENADSLKAISEKLALVNEQLAKSAERKRKVFRGLSIAGLGGVLIYAAWQIFAIIRLYSLPMLDQNVSEAVVGGADGPLSVFTIPSGVNAISTVIVLALLAVSVFVVCLTRRK